MWFGKHRENGFGILPRHRLGGGYLSKFIWRDGRIFLRLGRFYARLVYAP